MSDSDKEVAGITANTTHPVEVFFSYSHKDEEFRIELEKHLSLMKRNGEIAGWHDRKIVPGENWADKIDEHLESAGIVLLLVSADFLASDYCYEKEMTRAMQRHAEGNARVIPVILRACDWSSAPFSKLQALPKNARAIKSWPDQDEAYADVAAGIRRTVTEINKLSHNGLFSNESGVNSPHRIGRQVPRINTQGPTSSSRSATVIGSRALIGFGGAALIAALGLIALAIINHWGDGPVLGHPLTGRVFNKTKPSEPVEGAIVSLENEGAPPLATTDSRGIFTFPLTSDPNKEIRLRIEVKGYLPYDLRVVPAKNQGIQEIPLTPETEIKTGLTGTVLDRNEQPIQGAAVTLEDIPGMAPVETSSDGVFRLNDVPKNPGEGVRIHVSKEGYLPNPYTEDVVLGRTPPKIKLTKKK